MVRDWHCPPDCMGVELYGMTCPDDLGPDEPCVNGVLDDEEYKASEDPRGNLMVFKTEEDKQMVDFNKLRAGRDQRDKRTQQRSGAVVKPLPRSFVAVDFETTGFDRVNDRIIEIGAVRFTEGEPVAIFNTLVKQDVILSDEVTKVTGHTTEDIQKGMGERLALGILYEFMGADFPVVGHNVLFDYELYYRALERLHCEPPRHDLIDTLTISRERSGYPHKLPDMCKKYNVPQNDWHSAYFDALACGNLLLAMHAEDNKYPEGKQVVDYTNVIGWKRQYGEPLWKPSWVALKGQGTMHVQEGPRKARVITPRGVTPLPESKPTHKPALGKWFGQLCSHQICQYERDGEGKEDKSQPILIFCNHPDNPRSHEGNCAPDMNCPMWLSDDLPF